MAQPLFQTPFGVKTVSGTISTQVRSAGTGPLRLAAKLTVDGRTLTAQAVVDVYAPLHDFDPRYEGPPLTLSCNYP